MPGSSTFVLARALEVGVGLHALALEQAVAVLEVEQRARGDGDGQVATGRHAGVRRPRRSVRDCGLTGDLRR